jgi:hypothetical protein
MTDVLFTLEAPDRSWAAHVRQLIQDALGDRGSLQLELPPPSQPGDVEPPGFLLAGIAVCDEPPEEIHALIKAALRAFSVDESYEPPEPMKFAVASPKLGWYRTYFADELSVDEDSRLKEAGFKAELSQGPPLELPPDGEQIDIGLGAPYRVRGETEIEIRNRLVGALGREPKALRILRPAD